MSKQTSADTFPPSANGFCLEYVALDPSGKRETRHLVATWPAPFFVLCMDCDCGPPLLYHASNRADAERFMQSGGGRLLDAKFSEVQP